MSSFNPWTKQMRDWPDRVRGRALMACCLCAAPCENGRVPQWHIHRQLSQQLAKPWMNPLWISWKSWKSWKTGRIMFQTNFLILKFSVSLWNLCLVDARLLSDSKPGRMEGQHIKTLFNRRAKLKQSSESGCCWPLTPPVHASFFCSKAAFSVSVQRVNSRGHLHKINKPSQTFTKL